MPTRERARLFHAAVVRAFARASTCCAFSHTHKHGGPCRAHFKNAAAKRATRRLQKKAARRAARAGLARRLADG